MYDLLYAAAIGDVTTAERCLARAKQTGFLWGDLSRTCGRGRTALQYASLGGHIAAVACLIEAGVLLDLAHVFSALCF